MKNLASWGSFKAISNKNTYIQFKSWPLKANIAMIYAFLLFTFKH